MSDLSDLAVACNKILTLEKAIGENRFLRTLPFRQINPPTNQNLNFNGTKSNVISIIKQILYELGRKLFLRLEIH